MKRTALLILAFLLAPAWAQAAPLDSRKVAAYLENEYVLKLKSRDWRTRGLAVISLSRLPQESVLPHFQQLLEHDPHDVVRLLAWQAILARAQQLTPQQYVRWMTATLSLAEKGAFKGRLRVPLVNALAAGPADPRCVRIYQKLANDCNSWEPQDIPVLKALGKCLGAWKNATLAEALVNSLSTESYAPRAELILQEAGIDVPTARSLMPKSVWDPMAKDRKHPSSQELWQKVQQSYRDWLKVNRVQWNRRVALVGEPWKELSPAYLPPPVPIDQIDPQDKLWRADFELGNANVKAFEVAFCVDATGSMGEVLSWLSRDLEKMVHALSAAALEPRIGITFYRDHDDSFLTRVVPLTGNIRQLLTVIDNIGADGGGDIPEAVMEGLRDTLKGSKWSTRPDAAKAIVLIGDAPPHPQDVEQCLKIAQDARKEGFKFYAVKVTTDFGANDLTTFDQIAQAAGGVAIPCNFPRISRFKFLDHETGKEVPIQTIDRPEAQLLVAPQPPTQDPGEIILSQILADAINPQYRDRLGPLVKTLLAFNEPASKPEERVGFPADTPSLKRAKAKAQ